MTESFDADLLLVGRLMETYGDIILTFPSYQTDQCHPNNNGGVIVSWGGCSVEVVSC